MITSERILKARNDLKESQAVFAARFGVDQSTIHRWETIGVPDRGAAGYAVERVILDLETARPAEQAGAA